MDSLGNLPAGDGGTGGSMQQEDSSTDSNGTVFNSLFNALPASEWCIRQLADGACKKARVIWVLLTSATLALKREMAGGVRVLVLVLQEHTSNRTVPVHDHRFIWLLTFRNSLYLMTSLMTSLLYEQARVSGNDYCPFHLCEHPGCDQSKSSNVPACPEHLQAGDVLSTTNGADEDNC
jgi:hypothetical protein